MADHLLPRNATEFEIAFSRASDQGTRFSPPIELMRGIKFIGTPPDWMPFLIYEYGLGELTPYVPNLFDLIDLGIDWQRIRGTPGAVAMALGFLGYGGIIEEPPTRRSRWHLMQLELDRIRDNEIPDLHRIQGVVQLSLPVRSHFWRGYRTYDIRALEYGYKKWSEALYGSYSGARIEPTHAKWSFGRTYELDHLMTEGELTALGVWVDEVPPAPVETWEHVIWPHQQWALPSEEERVKIMTDDLHDMGAWVTFIDDEDDIIGHRKARALHPVTFGGATSPYSVDGVMLIPEATVPKGIYVEALTDFGDGFGSAAVKWQVRFGGTLVDPTRPGLLWAEPDELTGGIVAVEKVDEIIFGRTVRESCRALLRVV